MAQSHRFIATLFLVFNFKLFAVSSLLESLSYYRFSFNKVVFLGSGFRLFSILTSVRQMNYFQIRISREWSQNSNYKKPYVRFNKRTGVFYRATKKPRSEAVWLYHPVKGATH